MKMRESYLHLITNGCMVPIKKYKVSVLMTSERWVNERLEEMQNAGWEIAGDILVKNKTGDTGQGYLHIPMKMILNDKIKD